MSTASPESQPTVSNSKEATASISKEATASISKEAINALPLVRYDGPVTLVHNDSGMEEAIPELLKSGLLGFDTETRPSFSRGDNFPVALLQLATRDRVWLFQLLQIETPGRLAEVLSSPQILKVGVAIRDDIRKLQDLFPFEPGGFVELSDISRRYGVVNTGLRSLCAIFLEARVSKGAQVTNWSRKTLTEAQVVYAATDAWLSRRLYEKFDQLGFLNGHPVPPFTLALVPTPEEGQESRSSRRGRNRRSARGKAREAGASTEASVSPEARLHELGLTLPDPPIPAGSYVPFRRAGNLLFLAGTLSSFNGTMTHTGAVGAACTVEDGRSAARACALNALAAARSALGTLDRVARVVLVSGYVWAVPGFSESPAVINGASDLLVEVFGEAGQHARTAVAVCGLPRESTVEIQVTLEVKAG